MMGRPELSIIVLTCNQSGFTMRLLQSMLPYLREKGERVELIVVDNGSADGTAAAIEAFRTGNTLRNLRLLRSEENLGVARGRNLGLASAGGEVLMLLDNDTIADGETYDALLRHVAATPGCGIAAPALYSPGGELQASAKPYPGLWLKVAHLLRPGRELECEREELRKPHPFYVIGACQVFRREVYEKVGPLDAAIFYGPEDADFCIRVRKAGYTVDYLADLRLTHDWQRATRRSPFSRLGRLHAKALLHFWLKH
ncbi:MAG: glycosyltransferase family 2 protein [Muribaculaceae bacterium]|nr:glycosyltransferase family 2 protein [Muribaculaceae bacterium]